MFFFYVGWCMLYGVVYCCYWFVVFYGGGVGVLVG